MLDNTIEFKIAKFLENRDDLKLTDNEELYDMIKNGLIRNKDLHGDFYCPCKPPKTKENICPCEDCRKDGKCCCGIFEKK